MIKESMMKWRVRRETGSSIDQEDIRKSLDILDSVLAEYDDEGTESWRHSLPPGDGWREGSGYVNGCARRCTDYEFSRSRYDASSTASDGICFARSNSTNSFQSFAIDGGTSQSMPATFDQFRKFSPPPVPKRNPATRLSSHENLLFCSDSASVRDDVVAKRRSYAEGFNYFNATAKPFQNCPLSPLKGENESLLSRGGGGEVGVCESPKGNASNLMGETAEMMVRISNQRRPPSEITRSSSSELSPTQCRSSLLTSSKEEEVSTADSHNDKQQQKQYSKDLVPKSRVHMADLPRSASSSSMEINKSPTVAQRRAKFEMANHESLNRNDFRQKTSSSLAKRAINKSVEELGPSSREPSSPVLIQRLPVCRSFEFRTDAGSSSENVSTGYGLKSKLLPDEFDRAVVFESGRNGTNDTLSNVSTTSCVKNSVAAPTNEERIRQLAEKFAEVRRLLETKQILPLTTPPPSFAPPPPPKPPRKQRDSVKENQPITNTQIPPVDGSKNIANNDVGHPAISNTIHASGALVSSESLPPDLCNGCLKRGQHKDITMPSSTVDDIPKILPADVSKIPQLGFSYSMEEDLPPGAKDILTSTPKSELSTKSTFNDSISSLGYGSSQSDLDLNYPCKDGNKIPVDNIKSQTLPVGMKLGPDYYSDLNASTDCDSLENYGLKTGQSSFSPREANADDDVVNEEHFRSSSAPPFKLLEDEKRNKRSIFGMSRKGSKVKNKNECNTSTKLKTSLDDGIILRRLETLGNEYSLPDFKVNKEAAPVEEKKRRSVWKSILRRK